MRYLGWGPKYDEWIPRASRRLQLLNSCSHGSRGSAAPEAVVSDQELVFPDDATDPPNELVCQRKDFKVSVYWIENVKYALLNCRGLDAVLNRIVKEPTLPVSVRHCASNADRRA